MLVGSAPCAGYMVNNPGYKQVRRKLNSYINMRVFEPVDKNGKVGNLFIRGRPGPAR